MPWSCLWHIQAACVPDTMEGTTVYYIIAKVSWGKNKQTETNKQALIAYYLFV